MKTVTQITVNFQGNVEFIAIDGIKDIATLANGQTYKAKQLINALNNLPISVKQKLNIKYS